MPGALRLHLNENTAGCSPAVLAALRSMSREQVAAYPDTTAVTARCEAWFGVGPGWVQITNGLDEGIQVVAQCGAWHYRGAGRTTSAAGSRGSAPAVVIVEPAFEVYEACAAAVGADVVRIAPDTNFEFPMERLAAAIMPGTRVVYLADPNNPTGLGIPSGAVESIAAAAPEALVFVDEAYADFSGRMPIGPLLDRYRNLVIGRTFAKAHGLAALRVGALVAHPDTLDHLRRLLLPFSVNICAITALAAALDDRAYLEWYVAQTRKSRQMVYDFCLRHALTFWPSEANFVLIRVGRDAGGIVAALRDRGVLVRDKSGSPGCAGCIRLTAGVLEHTEVAISALEEILASRARGPKDD